MTGTLGLEGTATVLGAAVVAGGRVVVESGVDTVKAELEEL